MFGDTFSRFMEEDLKFTHLKEDIFVNQRPMVTRITESKRSNTILAILKLKIGATVLSRRKVCLLGDMKACTSDEHDFISYDKHEHIAGEINVVREEQGKN